MLVIMFKPEYANNMNNALVNVLIIIFACIYAVLTGINITRAFSDSERINNVLLFKGKDSATKASISVVKRIAKVATGQIEGAKLKKATLFVDENNDVRMKVDLKIIDKDIEMVVGSVKANLITTFDEVLAFRFKTIDFNVVNLKNPAYVPSPAKIKSEKERYAKEQADVRAIEDAKRQAEETEEKKIESVPAESKVEEVVEAPEVMLPDTVPTEEVAETPEVSEQAQSAVEPEIAAERQALEEEIAVIEESAPVDEVASDSDTTAETDAESESAEITATDETAASEVPVETGEKRYDNHNHKKKNKGRR